jgi:hypothetical protein
MLRTDTHEFTDISHLTKQIFAEHMTSSFCASDKASKHTDCCGFTSTIVPKQSKYLTTIHFKVNSIHGIEIAKSLF